MNVKKFVVVMKKYSRKLLYVYSSEVSSMFFGTISGLRDIDIFTTFDIKYLRRNLFDISNV